METLEVFNFFTTLQQNQIAMSKSYSHPFIENTFYHIYNRSNNNETIFRSHENYIFFLQRWKQFLSTYLDTYSYALIPNHFHFTVKVKEVDFNFLSKVKTENTVAAKKFLENETSINQFLEDQFKRFFISYSKAFNKQYNRNGSVFQKRFKRISAKDEVHLIYLITYNHHNPIHHGLVKAYGDWQYSSYKSILSDQATGISKQKVLNLFHPNNPDLAIKNFIEHHNNFQHEKELDFLIQNAL